MCSADSMQFPLTIVVITVLLLNSCDIKPTTPPEVSYELVGATFPTVPLGLYLVSENVANDLTDPEVPNDDEDEDEDPREVGRGCDVTRGAAAAVTPGSGTGACSTPLPPPLLPPLAVVVVAGVAPVGGGGVVDGGGAWSPLPGVVGALALLGGAAARGDCARDDEVLDLLRAARPLASRPPPPPPPVPVLVCADADAVLPPGVPGLVARTPPPTDDVDVTDM
ncbi:hypothetical protein Pelo_4712 [Pelomyxa schiedti]|nr:hypothetical protein Pelo_4712 [Pelomyxa schiedti]